MDAGPRARFRLEHEGNALRLIPEGQPALSESLSRGERTRAFLYGVAQMPKRGGPPIPAEALRWENMYD